MAILEAEDIWPENWQAMDKVQKKLHLERQIEVVLDALDDGSYRPGEVGLDQLRTAIGQVMSGLYEAAAGSLHHAIDPVFAVQPWPHPAARPTDLDNVTPEAMRLALRYLSGMPVQEHPIFTRR